MATATSPAQVYYARSDSDPTRFYIVAAVDGRCACGQKISGLYHCSCPDHVNRARDCKHVTRVVAGLIAPATARAA